MYKVKNLSLTFNLKTLHLLKKKNCATHRWLFILHFLLSVDRFFKKKNLQKLFRIKKDKKD